MIFAEVFSNNCPLCAFFFACIGRKRRKKRKLAFNSPIVSLHGNLTRDHRSFEIVFFTFDTLHLCFNLPTLDVIKSRRTHEGHHTAMRWSSRANVKHAGTPGWRIDKIRSHFEWDVVFRIFEQSNQNVTNKNPAPASIDSAGDNQM